MAGEPTTTITGNLTGDPELRFTPSGSAVVNFTVAVTPRVKDGDGWKDGETQFWRVSQWRDAAENVAESLTKGTRVTVEGRIKFRTYDHKDGYKVTVTELEAEEVGVSLRYATVKVTKTDRRGGGGGGGGAQQAQGGWGQGQPAQQPDPWSTGAGGYSGEPGF